MNRKRLVLEIEGIVQGVGFRPFVYRLARHLDLNGWVQNNGHNVKIEIEGSQSDLLSFAERILNECPLHSNIDKIKKDWLEPVGYSDFNFKDSTIHTDTSSHVLADLAVCSDCLKEMWDPCNRRYRYPFINCTDCGPRFSIIESMPYDRANTSMRIFPMCPDCQEEYGDPRSRRFHAQPIACDNCGPQLSLLDNQGRLKASKDEAIKLAAQAISAGSIVAIKGLGGFQILADARNESTISKLRKLKNRPAKPFALLYPNLSRLKLDAQVSKAEKELLQSWAAPIVLLRPLIRYKGVNDGCPSLGAMLPYTPLHYLLMSELPFAVVNTSGNISGDPLCSDNDEALARLGKIADLFLLHNRPIKIPLDDSLAQVIADRPVILRLGRGYAPLAVTTPKYDTHDTSKILSYGAQERNTVAFGSENILSLSAHIGDLDNSRNWQHCQKVIDHMSSLYSFKPTMIASDIHPDYNSTFLATEMARKLQLPLIKVQHHYAHVLSCMGEHQIEPPVLGVAWDGTGYGLDGTVWGGEFLQIGEQFSWQRVAHLRTFALPGGSSREPLRSALGLLWEGGWREDTGHEILQAMLTKGINIVRTSSMGRLFDALSYLLGLVEVVSFSGQAALALESCCILKDYSQFYPFVISGSGVIDWQPMVKDILEDITDNRPVEEIAHCFHNSLVEMIVEVAQRQNITNVVLTGGCFQNRYLLERSIDYLERNGFKPFWNQQVPTNDGGIAAGQILACMSKKKSREI